MLLVTPCEVAQTRAVWCCCNSVAAEAVGKLAVATRPSLSPPSALAPVALPVTGKVAFCHRLAELPMSSLAASPRIWKGGSSDLLCSQTLEEGRAATHTTSLFACIQVGSSLSGCDSGRRGAGRVGPRSCSGSTWYKDGRGLL